jgi:hypothetical protein
MGHSWFQHVLASNESKHPWMDNSFETLVSNDLATKKAANPFEGSYKTYSRLVESGKSNHYPRMATDTAKTSYNITSRSGSVRIGSAGVIGAQRTAVWRLSCRL